MSLAVGVVMHAERPNAVELARKVVADLEAAGATPVLTEADAVALGFPRHGRRDEQFGQGLAFAVSLGGDGTMLRAIDLVSAHDVPVMGVNLGRLGFLAEVEPPALTEALSRALAGDVTISERMLLEVVVARAGEDESRWLALNEAVLEKTHSGRLVRVGVSINGSYFTTYAADGVIVATPTGSTAYSFSARGPIISPSHRCVLLTPVSAHMLFDRALVLAPSETLDLEVVEEREVDLVVDGREVCALVPGDVVRCTAASRSAKIMGLGSRDFHQLLKRKFGLPS